MKFKSPLALLLSMVLSLGLMACSKVEYDYKALGFSDKAAMEAAFSKGYHTRQKLTEMTPKIVVAASASQVAASEPTPSASAPQVAASVTTPQIVEVAKLEPTKEAPRAEETKSADLSCTTLQTCTDAMLVSARNENIGQAIELAKRIDAMPKPNRGDRKIARKLNSDGLNALKVKNYDEAAKAFNSAREADPMDDEVIGNLAYTYGEEKKFSQSEKIAYEALLLNPQRANYWSTIAVAKQAQGKQKEALQAMWLTWQFAQKKQNLIEFFDKRISEETDENMKSLYVSSKSWLVDGKKPNF